MFETTIHWVHGLDPHRLGLSARPRGGDALADEVAAWRAAGIAVVVSLLEPPEVRELELRDEAALCAAAGIAFVSLPVPDRGLPAVVRDFEVQVDALAARLRAGDAVVVHCRAGIGRTGVLAGCLLHALGVPSGEIFHRLSRSRGVAMPDTVAQIDWVERHAARRAVSR